MAKRKSSSDDNGGVATAEPPKRGRPPKATQKLLNPNDPEFQRNKEIEDLASALDTVRSERVRLNGEESELQEKLAKAMRKAGIETYKAEAGMCILQHIDEDKVKIKKPKEQDED